MGVIIALDCFYEYSGLKLNASKCEIFTTGISANNLDFIINYSDFKHGTLPVRYLGVPLVTRKLIEKDCRALLDNIKSRLHQWSRKKMSYAGSNIPANGARVSWGKICKPKSEGGLGLKGIKTWNKACLIHLTRKLLAGEGSLWVAWIHNYIIKQQDFWTMDEHSSASWCFRRMQKIRSVAKSVPISASKSTKEIWEEIRPKDTKVPWHKLIWYPLHVPKYNIISWMINPSNVWFEQAFLIMEQSAGVGDRIMQFTANLGDNILFIQKKKGLVPQDFSTSWVIKATPTFVFLKDGQQIDKLVGANKPELQKKITAVLDPTGNNPIQKSAVDRPVCVWCCDL
ncbi:Thioredoxin H9 [Hibiscus syriacus]|uniref:Thioredoxin H9 n=1 Tax=Hibiscus syriacus TaxID=106335 RepID=A0A6A2ZZE0_HIBSY|nr:Thioredoxin H9 [Hibiscus syriacus]